MRHILLVSLLCAVTALPSAALAQEKATRSVDDYLCTFAGKCSEDGAEEVTKDAPATKGFSLARPGVAKSAAPKASAAAPVRQTAGAASTTRPAAAPAPAKAKQSYASTSKAKVAKAAKSAGGDADQKRADLRLTFELGSATLTPQAMEEAKVFAESLKRPELAPMRFRIEGHTDSQGGRAYNMDLSRRRAEAVADYLTSLGVARDRFEVEGYGFDRPLNGLSAAAQENRRVEAVLTS